MALRNAIVSKPSHFVGLAVKLTTIGPGETTGALFKSTSSNGPPFTSALPNIFESLSHMDLVTSSASTNALAAGGQPATDTGPIPMSFPAILRAPKLANRFAHLRYASALEDLAPDFTRLAVKNKREDREGKRWIRRKENCMLHWLNEVAKRHTDEPSLAHFVGNPHVVTATKNDYQILLPEVKSTFPEPLPVYLSRNAPLSTLIPACKPDPNSSSAGRFSLSIKGTRKELRKAGARAQYLIKDVESEIVSWLDGGAVFLSPDEKDPNDFEFPGKPVGASGAIHEVARTPLQLVWAISEDGFARYVVHCCARYHEIVSFSKDTSGQRLTYLLRPNVSRPSQQATNLDTPPATDFGYSSPGDFEDESDIILSDHELASSIDSLPPPPSISPGSGTRTAFRVRQCQPDEDDGWSIIGDVLEADAELSGNEGDMRRIGSAVEAIPEESSPGNLATEDSRFIRGTPLSRVWNPRPRNNSSQSRSPARRSCESRKTVIRHEPPRDRTTKSFYMYLFGDR